GRAALSFPELAELCRKCARRIAASADRERVAECEIADSCGGAFCDSFLLGRWCRTTCARNERTLAPKAHMSRAAIRLRIGWARIGEVCILPSAKGSRFRT